MIFRSLWANTDFLSLVRVTHFIHFQITFFCVHNLYYIQGGGRVVRWCWVNFKCLGVLLIWIRVGQGPSALVVGVGGGCLDIFSLVYHFSFLSPSLWETARYRLKYCLKGLLSRKQPTNQIHVLHSINIFSELI